MKTESEMSFTTLPIIIEGWFPPKEPGLLPSVKATWDGRMLQLFSDNLEQAEADLRFLAQAQAMLAKQMSA